jgi:hypothetical protein
MNSIRTFIGKTGLGHEPLFETDDLAAERTGRSSMIFIPKHLKSNLNVKPIQTTITSPGKSPNPNGKVEKRQSDGVINGTLTKKIKSATSSGTHSIGVRRA